MTSHPAFSSSTDLRRFARFVVSTSLALCGMLACSAATTDGTGGGPPTLVNITVDGPSAAILPGDSADFTATAHYSDNSQKSFTDSATWSVSDATIETVDNTTHKGRVHAIKSGTATVSAWVGSVSGTRDVSVASVASISLQTSSGTQVLQYQTLQLKALASYTSTAGGQNDVTTSATWTSSDPTKARVSSSPDSAGLVVGTGGGTVTITAAYMGQSATTSLTAVALDSLAFSTTGGFTVFHPAGDSLPISLTAYYGSGTDISQSADWSSSNTAAVTVNNTAGKKGETVRVTDDSSFITATWNGIQTKMLLRKTCTVLAAGQKFNIDGGNAVGQLALDGSSVVWLDWDSFLGSNGGAFRSVPTGGGTVHTYKSDVAYLNQFVVDADAIYWMWVDASNSQTYHVVRLSKATGQLDSLIGNGGLGGGSRGIAEDAQNLYWPAAETNGMRSIPKAGGAYHDFASNSGFAPLSIALDGGYVYGVDTYGSPTMVRRINISTGAMDTLSSQARSSMFVATDANNVYWAENFSGNSRIASVPKAGGSVTTIVQMGNVYGFAVAGGYVYFGVGSSTATLPFPGIYRVPTSGGTPELVTNNCPIDPSSGMSPQGLAVDATYIYFSDNGGAATGQARILRVRR